MAPSSARARPSAFDRFTDASASAISSGYSAVLSLGPQPKGGNLLQQQHQQQQSANSQPEGVSWLKNLKQFSGMYDGTPGSGIYVGDPTDGRDNSDEEEDGDSDAESANRPKKKARGGLKGKRNSKGSVDAGATEKDSAAASRKAQNRLAQREFRQRKQQYIRALETRVELMSSDHDTQVDRLRFALRGLLAENNQLRQIVAGMTNFVGSKQIGGPLQEAGVSREELEFLITNSAEKVMTEVWQHWPGAKECETLRQLRLESNLPPEGLPESNKFPEQGSAPKSAQLSAMSSAMTSAAAQAAAANSSPSSSKATPPSPTYVNGGKSVKNAKGKAEQTRTSNRKRKGTTEKDSSTRDESPIKTPQQIPVPAEASLVNGEKMTNEMAFSLPSDNSQVLASFFQNGGNNAMVQNDLPTPSAFTFTPSFTGLITPSIGGVAVQSSSAQHPQQQHQESNALLASLFGTSGMTGFLSPGQSMANGMMNPFVSQSGMGYPQQQQQQANQVIQSPLNRQKAKVEGGAAEEDKSEEIERINRLMDRLKREYNQYGSGRDPVELDRIGEQLNELSRQMNNFRRQPSYQLPLILRPSEIQQTRPHDPLIDVLPFPGVRQNIIAQQESLVIEDVVLNILQYCQFHHPSERSSSSSPLLKGNNNKDDNHEQNWELLYGFLIAYPQLVDQRTLDIANRWRVQRKESILSFDDLTLQ